MFQGSSDANRLIRRLKGNDSAGRLQDGSCSLGMVLPAVARPCRGLQDLQTRDHGPTARISREAQRGRRDGLVNLSNKSSQWSPSDSLATEAKRKATFGDTRRQLLGPRVGVGRRDLPGRRWSTLQCDLLESKHAERFTSIETQSPAIEMHIRARMESGSATWKPSKTTTKNDNMKNQINIRTFWSGPSGWVTDSPAECGSDSVFVQVHCAATRNSRVSRRWRGPYRRHPLVAASPVTAASTAGSRTGQSCNILMSTHKIRLIFKSRYAGGCPLTARTWIRLR